MHVYTWTRPKILFYITWNCSGVSTFSDNLNQSFSQLVYLQNTENTDTAHDLQQEKCFMVNACAKDPSVFRRH